MTRSGSDVLISAPARSIKNLNARSEDLRYACSYRRVFLLLLLLATVFRLPWFFQDVINWDESVFILVGDALANGHLPYTVVWDNKPPLGFVFYALIIRMVPDSLASIRLGGAVLVALASLFVFSISIRMMARQYALLSSALCVIAISVLITGGMAVMMEHVALVPLLGAFVLLDEKPLDARRVEAGRLCAVGALLAVAALVRPNLVFVPITLLLALPVIDRRSSRREKLVSTVCVTAGILLTLAAVFLVYLLDGNGRLLVDSVISVPLAYSRSGMGHLAAAENLLRYALRWDDQGSIFEPRRVLSIFFWMSGVIGIASIAFSRRYRGSTATYLLVFAVAIWVSMIASGQVWEHHLIQIAPFFAVGAGLVVSTLPGAQRPHVAIAFVCALAIAFTVTRLQFYRALARACVHHEDVYTGDIFEIAKYLRHIAKPGDTLFVTNDILLYWLMDTYPLTPVSAFPANLWEDAILTPLYGPTMTTEAALRQVVSRQPTRIVLPRPGSALPIAGDPRRVFPQELLEGYYLENTVAGRLIYRRR
jgi:4-amino-4-deoxy-L-arabinose transferase-like glycosyltransferase